MDAQSKQITNRVLIADDDPCVVEIVRAIAEDEGYQVVTAADGVEAYRILHKDTDFKLLIFDMIMPHLEGCDLLRQLKTEKRLSRIPVIMMSGSPDLNVISDSFHAGAVAFVPKPFQPSQMRDTLRLVTVREEGAPPLQVPRIDDGPLTNHTVNVLLIEDNPGEAIVIEAILSGKLQKLRETLSLDITRAESLSEGMDRLLEGGIDLVLLDLTLPDSDGLDTLRKVLEHNDGVPVVVLTGTGDQKTKAAVLALGAQDFLVKGEANEKAMVEAVHRAFDERQLSTW